jgi:hypothetical protein
MVTGLCGEKMALLIPRIAGEVASEVSRRGKR